MRRLYNISIDLHTEFEKVCKQKGLSLRKGIHMALTLLVNLIKEEGNEHQLPDCDA
ncbi:hypothetical protein MBAV_006356 [Candidatus Magnetobacterium bavaricum]|uniref:CopG family transcriptional regulator n=1 Tax=Candidatus Magnetobacterium bavaricum TaxID=29290 RepID=A0A0F3GI03_9BACT|nr:hypothetical protein MBAV_006356 [Candidatus Magnetobacterium bavaricum]